MSVATLLHYLVLKLMTFPGLLNILSQKWKCHSCLSIEHSSYYCTVQFTMDRPGWYFVSQDMGPLQAKGLTKDRQHPFLGRRPVSWESTTTDRRIIRKSNWRFEVLMAVRPNDELGCKTRNNCTCIESRDQTIDMWGLPMVYCAKSCKV